MSITIPTRECAVQFESQVNGYTNQGTNDIAHFISNGLVVSWVDFDGNPGGNLGGGGGTGLLPNNNNWSGINTFSKSLQGFRFYANQGTAYSGSDSAIALAAGWGTGAAVSGATGYDGALNFSVTAAGTPTASPNIVITFKNGSWGNVPQFIVMRNDTNSPYWGVPHTISVSATALTITFNGLPIAGTTYSFICMGIGN